MDNKLKWRKYVYFFGSHKSYLKVIYATSFRIRSANIFELIKTLVIKKNSKSNMAQKIKIYKLLQFINRQEN